MYSKTGVILGLVCCDIMVFLLGRADSAAIVVKGTQYACDAIHRSNHGHVRMLVRTLISVTGTTNYVNYERGRV